MINVSEEMKQLHKLAKQTPGQVRKPLWGLVTSPEWLAQAWEEIRRNRGSQTAGVDETTAIDVDINLIHQIAEEMKAGTYRPKPVRRVNIPKANGKTRPLGIPTIKDRVVQQALRMVLEPVFEADFLRCSHGFRQGKSTHTALRDVALNYPPTSWIIEGDIKGCFDNIPHGKLMSQIGRRVADEKVLSLVRLFLKAGYMEDWKYHKTYSGTPQGGVISPLLANIFLHQLDKFIEDELKANQNQTKKEKNSWRNPEYRRIENKITILRRKLKETDREGHKLITDELTNLERQLKQTPHYDKDKKKPCKVKYVRYADDFVVLVAGNKEEAKATKNKIKAKLSEMGLELSEEKTKITHWDQTILFLGYEIKGKLRRRGIGIKAILGIPQEKVQKVKDEIEKVCSYHHIPEADTIIQVNAIFRGWCNYYQYASNPQKVFQLVSQHTWWQYAHFLARKQKASIASMIQKERKAKRLDVVEKEGRARNTFQCQIGEKRLTLNIFPPKTGQIRTVSNNQEWKVDMKPVNLMNWQSGRSLTTRLAALDRAKGVCERCKERPVEHVHHTVPIKGKTFLARTMSDRSQRETAVALCKECHLEAHGGSFKKQKLRGNAGCAERCLSGVGSAVEKPVTEM